MLLIRFLIISICILYIIRRLARVFLPMLFQGMVNKAQQQQFNRQQEPKRSEERVKVDYVPPAPKSTIPDNEGDFIDYEEVK
jgi:hypothetical protein